MLTFFGHILYLSGMLYRYAMLKNIRKGLTDVTEVEREDVLIRAKDFFRTRIAQNHMDNTLKLSSKSQFNINPFLHKYLARFAFGDSSPESMAKAILYPRVLGTSISTTFGTQLQFFCNEVLSSYASTTSGIDIEFVDAVDGRKKYCQIKAGPTTINHDDVTTILTHFKSVRNLARTNHLDLRISDCIVGVFYGTEDSLSQSYKHINEEYPVYVGKEFWYRLTGDVDFYDNLINAFAEVAEEINGKIILERITQKLADSFK